MTDDAIIADLYHAGYDGVQTFLFDGGVTWSIRRGLRTHRVTVYWGDNTAKTIADSLDRAGWYVPQSMRQPAWLANNQAKDLTNA